LNGADIDRAMIDLEQIVAQAVDTDSTVVPFRRSLATARAFQSQLMMPFVWVLRGARDYPWGCWMTGSVPQPDVAELN